MALKFKNRAKFLFNIYLGQRLIEVFLCPHFLDFPFVISVIAYCSSLSTGKYLLVRFGYVKHFQHKYFPFPLTETMGLSSKSFLPQYASAPLAEKQIKMRR